MNIKAEKALLKSELEKIDDISLLRVLRQMALYGLKNEGRISNEQYNRELDEAEAEVAQGKSITHRELKKQMAGWQKRASRK